MIGKIKSTLSHTLLNLPGWHTKRRIVVIESDDWGSIRMPSKEVYEKCLRQGYRVDINPYERYDSLASQDDLELLFNLLSQFRDIHGNHPVITANCVVANPDFEKIKDSNFQEYHYELITETFERYPHHKNNFNLWLNGKENRLFYPQFHAREHLNVSLFMKALRENDPDVRFGFENQMPGSIRKGNNNGNYFVEATFYDSLIDKNEKLKIYIDGLGIFEKIFRYKSESIVPPNYTWSKDYNKVMEAYGVKFIQGSGKMREPVPGKKPKYSRRFMGHKNAEGQLDLVRNVSFEPTLTHPTNTVPKTLAEIALAFKMQKPAVISSHRINYVGYLDEKNRDNNLRSLKVVLKEIIKRWSNVEFMNSIELGHYINQTLKK